MTGPDGSPAAKQAKELFAAELRRWRLARGWTKRELAQRMSFDPSYVCHVERGHYRATEGFARRADQALSASGAIWDLWQSVSRDLYQRTHQRSAYGSSRRAASMSILGASLVVERDEAEQYFDGRTYLLRMRRYIRNVGTEAIVRYLIRINVHQEPDNSPDSRQQHDPLDWTGLELSAQYVREDGDRVLVYPMTWRPETDQDALKEVWLLFRNSTNSFPLYPGERACLEYSYRVAEGIWGHWFQRAVRHPTEYLLARLVFPVDLDPGLGGVWGTEITNSWDRPIAPTRSRCEEGLSYYEWEVQHPPFDSRYRVEWRLPNAVAVNPAA